MARPRRSPARTSRPSAASKRAKTVWLALLGSMTAVGGVLLMIDRTPAPFIGGTTMPALAATDNVESILNTKKPLDKQRWKAIVIHHSDSPIGSPESIAKQHAQQGFKGIGHHFVIGNGRGMDNGDLHVTFRWLEQQPGAHTSARSGPINNNNTISICLVGDGDRERFTPAQLDRLTQIVDTLCSELQIPKDKVYLHSQLAPTSDPGKFFPAIQFREGLGLSH